MNREQPDYSAYLLRIWRVDRGDEAHWRASLERPSNGERLVFADLEELFDFLRRRTGAEHESSSNRPAGRDGEGHD